MNAAAREPSCARALPVELVWIRNGEDSAVNAWWYRISVCGRYSVAKICDQGELSWEAWVRGKPELVRNLTIVVSPFIPPKRLGRYREAELARNRCLRHAREEARA